MRYLSGIAILVSLAYSAGAQLNTSKLFGNHMVLQRNQTIAVWGKGAKGGTVAVKFNGQSAATKVDRDGNWQAQLKPMEAGGPYTMEISANGEKLEYNDIMVGEVWICSGQSNMEFTLTGAYGYKAEQNAAAQMPVRQFLVPKKISLQPEKELGGGQWVAAGAGTVGDFTAVGYFFAKKLQQTLHVTIGLINSSWGGTEAEDWISKEALLQSPELGPAAKELPISWEGVTQRLEKKLKFYAFGVHAPVSYFPEKLALEKPSFFTNWPTGFAPGAWEWMGNLYSYRGTGFMQKTFLLDSTYTHYKSSLHLGQTDAEVAVYVNGRLIQKGPLKGGLQLFLPDGIWKPGENSLLIQLLSQQKKPAGFGLGLNGTGNDLYLQFDDTSINLAGGEWRVMPDLSKPYHFNFLPNNNASTLYNTMISPIIPYAIAGVIWYQGEQNAGRAYQYRTTFPVLINDWRSRWKTVFPFLFVQLSSYGGSQDSNMGSNWAELREAQTMTLKLPNTGMAVTTDIGDAGNIHPRNKSDVGYRLADKALGLVYHLPGFCESPLYHSAIFKDSAALITFIHTGTGLTAKDKYGYVRGFEIAGPDHVFYYAQAAIVDSGKVKVWSPNVPAPAAVRFAWTNAPIDANLFNREGFPVSPFRTDDWPGVTERNKFE